MYQHRNQQANRLSETTCRSEVLKAALGSTRDGASVFPLKGKAPLTAHGYKDASRNPSRVTAMFNASPAATGYGIATGQASGIVVVDVDGPEGVAEAERRGLRSEYVVKTGRPDGDGWHIYLSIPKGLKLRSCRIAPGLELKAEGCYVVGPGSRHPGGGRYKVVKDGEPSPAPEWVKEPDHCVRPSRRRETSMVGGEASGPIHEGSRNQTLFFMALDRKDQAKSREEVLGELLNINEARCSPALAESEVSAIVKSAFRYPLRGKRTPPEVLEVLEQLKRAWWTTAWRGVGGKSDRDILRVLIQLAERYGQLIPAGVRVSISWRDLAIAAGCGFRTVARVVKRLRIKGWLRGDNAQRCGTESGAFVLLPRPTGITQNIGGGHPPDDGSDATLSTLPQTTPCFRWRGFVGKGKAGVLYILEILGPQSLEEIAGRLGWKSVRDLKCRYLKPLAELGLIEDRGGVYVLPGEPRYQERIAEIRRARYGGGLRKVRRRDQQGRWVSHVVEVSPKSEDEREEADRLAYEGDRRKYRGEDVELTPHVANTGTDEFTWELEREGREAGQEERQEAIRAAIARLFSDRPEYRSRRVGQITCAITMHYLGPDFPRGTLGVPKDAEVESILDGAAA